MNKSVETWPSALGRSLHVSIMLCLRSLLHALPISVRRHIVETIMNAPLWLSRRILNIATSPIGEQRKWIHEIEQSSWKGAWIVPDLNSLKEAEDTASNNDLVIFYTHGGGYCKGHAKMYMETFQLIVNHLRDEHKIRASILSLEYSLSPENVWPKARDEAMDAYRYLIDTVGVPASKIVFAGDSAGGNLAATVLLTLKDQEHLPLPAGAALLSPWIDLTINQPSYAQRNDILSREQVDIYALHYVPNYNNLDEKSRLSAIRNPLISPLYGDFSGTCPIFLAYGEKELLRTSIENFELNLKKDGCRVTTLKGENALHIWLMYSLIASSKEVFERDCKAFVNWMASICTQK